MTNQILPNPALSPVARGPEPEAARTVPPAVLAREPLPGFDLLGNAPGGDGGREHYAQALALAASGQTQRFEAGVPAPTLVRQRAEFMDRLVTRIWQSTLGDASRDLALVAVGGYGRAELHPGSDVDLMVLLPGPAEAHTETLIQAYLQMLWDLGLDVGASVRTVEQCVEESLKDITVATTLMEARLLAGAQMLFARMRSRTGNDAIWPSRKFFEAKLEEQRARHARFHDTAYNLEPNLKESPGGLRDIQMVGWVAKRHFGANTLDELVSHRFLTSSEHALLVEGQDFLWSVRFALHSLTGRREDRLSFDLQRRVAQTFGYLDDDANLAVEKFMKRYYRTAMALSHLNELLLELFLEAFLAAQEPTDVQRVNRRFRTVNGALEVKDDKVFQHQPYALLELFLILQQREDIKGVRASTIRLVRDNVHLIDDAFRNDLSCRSLFLEILRQPRGINHGLKRMHRYGVLGAYLPVFGEIVGRMQYDLFHAYTVDEHTLFVVRNLRAFSDPKRRDELPLCSRIANTLPKPELLYLAGLFHDIAKGRGGDHSELGASDAAAFCVHHGLSDYDARLVSWLVGHHLLMSTTAQKRDITDPDVVTQFAATVGDQSRLDYLYLLTVADIRGTNPNLWSSWKGTLLSDLYHSTARVLRQGLENPLDRDTLIDSNQREANKLLMEAGIAPELARPLWESVGEDYFVRYSADEIAWHTGAILSADPATRLSDDPLIVAVREARGGSEIFVYARDQKNLFATTTSVLGREGLNIVEARVITADNGMTLDAYLVLDLHAGSGAPALSDQQRQRALREQLVAALETEQTARAVVERRLVARKLESFDRPTLVNVSPDANHLRTVIEVNSRDRPGLLGRIGWAFADTGVRLQTAKIATFGERAEDVFYVTDTHNRPLDPSRFEAIAKAITEAIDTDPAA